MHREFDRLSSRRRRLAQIDAADPRRNCLSRGFNFLPVRNLHLAQLISPIRSARDNIRRGRRFEPETGVILPSLRRYCFRIEGIARPPSGTDCFLIISLRIDAAKFDRRPLPSPFSSRVENFDRGENSARDWKDRWRRRLHTFGMEEGARKKERKGGMKRVTLE